MRVSDHRKKIRGSQFRHRRSRAYANCCSRPALGEFISSAILRRNDSPKDRRRIRDLAARPAWRTRVNIERAVAKIRTIVDSDEQADGLRLSAETVIVTVSLLLRVDRRAIMHGHMLSLRPLLIASAGVLAADARGWYRASARSSAGSDMPRLLYPIEPSCIGTR